MEDWMADTDELRLTLEEERAGARSEVVGAGGD